MQHKNQSQKFKKLQEKWYEKLKKEGFDDIEQDERQLKIWTSHRFKLLHKTAFDAKAEYYQLAGKFFYDHKFADSREKRIWELHSNGHTMVAITTIMKAENFKVYKDLVQNVITKLAKIMVDNANK